jgi:hypothetical protein
MSAVLNWEMDASPRTEQDRGPDEAVEVLRGVWTASGQSAADLEDAFGPQKSCKRMSDVGFDGYSESSEGADLRTAWRDTLNREGKLGGGGSVRDLVFGRDS